MLSGRAQTEFERDTQRRAEALERQRDALNRSRIQLERSTEDLKRAMADYQLKKTREIEDIWRNIFKGMDQMAENGKAYMQPGGAPGQMAPPGAGGRNGTSVLPNTKGGPNWNEGPGYGRGRLHRGQDLGADPNDPVAARRNGRVVDIYRSFGGVGDAAVVKYDNGEKGVYGHIKVTVGVGQDVKAGQVIGKVFNEGLNSHLHYELYNSNGTLNMNPAAVLRNKPAPAPAPAPKPAPASPQLLLNTSAAKGLECSSAGAATSLPMR